MSGITLSAQSDYFSFLPAETREQIYERLDIRALNCFASTCKEFQLLKVSLDSIQKIFALNSPTADHKKLLREMPLAKYMLIKEKASDLQKLSNWSKIGAPLTVLDQDFIALCLKDVKILGNLIPNFFPKYVLQEMQFLNQLSPEKFAIILDHSQNFKMCFVHKILYGFNLEFIKIVDSETLRAILDLAKTKEDSTGLFGTQLLRISDHFKDLATLNGLKPEHFSLLPDFALEIISLFKMEKGLDIESMNLFTHEQLKWILQHFFFFPITFQHSDKTYDWEAISKLSLKKIDLAVKCQTWLRYWLKTSDKILDFLHMISEDKLQLLCEYLYFIERLFLTRYDYINGSGSFFDSQAFIDMPLDELIEKMANVTKADRLGN
jgi:hypothetical protein